MNRNRAPQITTDNPFMDLEYVTEETVGCAQETFCQIELPLGSRLNTILLDIFPLVSDR